MPEGPSIVILREQAERFVGRRVLEVTGNSRLEIRRLHGRTVRAVRSWGKQFLMDFGTLSLRVHFMLWGSYRIDQPRDTPPRLGLRFRDGRIDFYSASLRLLEEDLDALYDWSADVMGDAWDPAAARRKLRAQPDTLVCDALLDQNVFSGVGNIIKNEVLFRIRTHPESTIGGLPPRKLGELVRQARAYSFDFYGWKKANVLKKHWRVHTRSTCPRDGAPVQYRKALGRAQRRAFWCDVCQKRYD